MLGNRGRSFVDEYRRIASRDISTLSFTQEELLLKVRGTDNPVPRNKTFGDLFVLSCLNVFYDPFGLRRIYLVLPLHVVVRERRYKTHDISVEALRRGPHFRAHLGHGRRK